MKIKTRVIYFAVIALVSLAFFALQLYANSTGPTGIGSIVLLILWGVMAAFGIAGFIWSMSNKNRHGK